MNKKFAERIEQYLSCECDDYGMHYKWEWCEDSQDCQVEVTNDYSDSIACLNFRYDEQNDDLMIEITEDCYTVTREFDNTVRYFWMLVSPVIFSIYKHD